jgi:hypothetical protein
MVQHIEQNKTKQNLASSVKVIKPIDVATKRFYDLVDSLLINQEFCQNFHFKIGLINPVIGEKIKSSLADFILYVSWNWHLNNIIFDDINKHKVKILCYEVGSRYQLIFELLAFLKQNQLFQKAIQFFAKVSSDKHIMTLQLRCDTVMESLAKREFYINHYFSNESNDQTNADFILKHLKYAKKDLQKLQYELFRLLTYAIKTNSKNKAHNEMFIMLVNQTLDEKVHSDTHVLIYFLKQYQSNGLQAVKDKFLKPQFEQVVQLVQELHMIFNLIILSSVTEGSYECFVKNLKFFSEETFCHFSLDHINKMKSCSNNLFSCLTNMFARNISCCYIFYFSNMFVSFKAVLSKVVFHKNIKVPVLDTKEMTFEEAIKNIPDETADETPNEKPTN